MKKCRDVTRLEKKPVFVVVFIIFLGVCGRGYCSDLVEVCGYYIFTSVYNDLIIFMFIYLSIYYALSANFINFTN